MSDTLPATASPGAPQASLLTPLTDPAGGSAMTRLRNFGVQPGVRRMLPWFLGLAAIGGAAVTWSALAPSPQRTLYAQLADNERAGVVEALDKAGITYSIDNQSGALSVAEGDFYRARMLDTHLAPGPETIEARLFHEHEIPWEALAFRTVRETLKLFFADRRRGQFGVHNADMV